MSRIELAVIQFSESRLYGQRAAVVSLSRKPLARQNSWVAKPFLKWAGGKGKLAERVLAGAPAEFGRYYEPFAGGAAVFFALGEKADLSGRASLSDANAELIECFGAVRDRPGGVIAALRPLAARYLAGTAEERGSLYYEQRAVVPGDAISRAARLIFLNKTCYNGLYRVNSRGGFNVPHGRYQRPGICDEANLHACSAALRGVELCVQDFEKAGAAATAGDFVYLDPPYHPLSATSSFTAYTSGDFGPREQTRLAEAFADLTRRGVCAMLSNSDHPAIRDLYGDRGYAVEVVSMSRAINSKGDGRASINELLITNFR